MSLSIQRACADVQADLGRIGLRNLVLWVEVVVSVHPLHHWGALGWYGMAPHTITIPRYAVSLANRFRRLRSWWGAHPLATTSLRDVLRHEYGHALRDCLGGFDCPDSLWGADPCVTDYAASQETPADRADEDFAEAFMLIMKHHGVPPRSWRHPRLQRKWQTMRRAIIAGSRVRLPGTVRCPHRGCGALLAGRTGSLASCPACGGLVDLR